ncbi:hypothetical protein ACFVHB_18930 [Kitasatospora sp. NPDC127111]|uniref:SCO2583/SCO2584 N-terminal domain-containing protein n=1 Tax=Kitasatospora sp. NPDC127111 TaxID=3345363 RepID=UPI003637BF52
MPIAEDPEPRPSEGRDPDGADPSGAGSKDPFADLVLDEEFVKGATVKEQAGRTRMLAARWKHTPPVDPGGRRSVNDRPAKAKRRFGRKPKLAVVDPWGNPRPRRRRVEWRAPLYLVLVVAVLLAAFNVDSLKFWYSTHYGYAADHPASANPVPTVGAETARPTAAPPKAAEKQPTVDHPWAGSPAEGWPAGAAGIDVPKDPQATGVFSAEQVAAQLKLVGDYLAAANLDPRLVAGGSPDAALALMDEKGREVVAKTLTAPSAQGDATSWFTRFDPREAIPVSDTVKVQGRISYESDGDKGVLVKTDVTYVYALRPGPEAGKRAASPKPSASRPAPAGSGTAKPVGLVVPAADAPGDTWTTRTIVRRVVAFRFYDPKRFRVDPAKLVIADSNSDFGNSACDTYDGYLHPQFDQFAPVGQDPTGPASDPYDRTKDLPDNGDGSCGTVTRN